MEKIHDKIHWAVFVAVALLLTSYTLFGIQKSIVLQEGSNMASSIMADYKDGKVSEAEDYILVKFKKTLTAKEQEKVLSRNNLKEKSEIKAIGVKLVSISLDDTPQEAVDKLKAKEKDNLEFAEVDAVVYPGFIPNDPLYSGQWQLPKMSSEAAWGTTQGSSNIIIAILDTGVNCSHEDLAPRCVPGWNIIDNNSNTADVHGHGTAVAGAAAAAGNNGIGISSPCPNCSIMPVRIANANAYATWSKVASGIIWAADHGARVANVSYGSSSGMWNSSSVVSAAQYMMNKNGLVIIVSGNGSTYSSDTDNPYLVVVGGVDQNDVLYSWSNYGPYVDMVAAGCITTTNNGGGYGGWCGTSFSAPTAAGVAGLVLSKNPSLSATQLLGLLKQNTDDIYTPGFDIYSGWGRPNMNKAVLAAGTGPVPDTTPPSAPTNLSASAPDGTKVNLVWTASTDNVGVPGYQIFKDDNQIGTVSSTNYTDTNVTSGASYSYTVRAYDNAGNVSLSSNAVSVTMPTVSTKVSILNYSVTNKTATTATITWTTNVPSTGFVSYSLSSGNLNISATDGIIGTTHSVTITNLNKLSKYYYKITSTGADGSSTASSPVSNFKTNRK